MNNETKTIEDSKVDFLRQALVTHAKQVKDFCTAGVSRIGDYDDKMREKHGDEFISRALILVNQLEALMITARRAPALKNTLNLEQLEAQVAQINNMVKLAG